MKKYVLILILCLVFNSISLALTYTSQYPPAHNDTYVKATSHWEVIPAYHYYATDPAKSLTGSFASNSWYSEDLEITNQRFHIDLGSAKVIKRIYYENSHHEGGFTTRGGENFTFWGSNVEASFLELTYGTDTGWTEITVAQNTFDIHVSADQADPKYIVATNATAYRYYAFKIADNHGSADFIGLRRIELQTEDAAGITWNGITITKWNGVTITIPINTQ